MTRIVLATLASFTLGASVAVACPGAQKSAANTVQVDQANAGETVQLAVSGMSCPPCEGTVAGLLKNVDGVLTATADAEAGVAKVTWAKDAKVDNQALVDAIADSGKYTAKLDAKPLTN